MNFILKLSSVVFAAFNYIIIYIMLCAFFETL